MSATKPSVGDLRRINRQAALQQLYFHAPLSRLEISRRCGVSPATMTNVVSELLEQGIITESGSKQSEGGRPHTLLSINPDYGAFVGIDVGETHVRIELFDLTLHNLGTLKQPVAPKEVEPAQVVQHIVEGLHELLAESGLTQANLVGIGIGVPGVVEQAEGLAVFTPNWGWHRVPLLTMLKEHFDTPIYLDNGAKAMALAEMWFGAGRGTDSLAVLLIGTGVGAGIIAGGMLYRGVTNSAGEWGHTSIDLDGRPCRCGSRGCLEAYVGAPGIIERLRELDPQNDLLADEANQMITIPRIIEAARKAEPAAAKVLEDTIHYLGAGIANLINLFNPKLIVLGGWVGVELGQDILPKLHAIVERYALERPLSATTLSLSRFGQDAVCLGAASLALEDFLRGGNPDWWRLQISQSAQSQLKRPAPQAVV